MLERGEWRRARRLVAPWLTRRRANVGALVVHAAGLMQRREYASLVVELERRPWGTRRSAVLCMLMVLALCSLERLDEAQRWLPLAQQEPVVAAALQRHPAFSRLADRLRGARS